MPPTVIDLILTDDEAERTRLEKMLKVTQQEIVNHYVEICAAVGRPIRPPEEPGTPEERREALRSFLRNTRGTGPEV